MKSVSLKQRLAGKKSLKKNWMQKESVSKQGRKSAKDEPSVHKDPLFDELDDDEIDKLETEMPRNGEGQDQELVLTRKKLVPTDQMKKIKGKKKIEEEDESDTESEVKRFDESFTVVGSTKDERKIKEINEGAKDLEHKRLKKKVAKETPKKEDTTKIPAKVDVTEQGTIDSEIMEIKSFISKLDKGDLKIMMESSTKENVQSDFWNDQQHWEIVTWRLYEACGVYILELEDGTVIHMLVERRYPLSKDLLQRMLDTGLEVERESTTAIDLIKFIKQQIDEE
ncbi:hypothetical protein Tco_0902879 [Tanacetum coccineum]